MGPGLGRMKDARTVPTAVPSSGPASPAGLEIVDLGRMEYRAAWRCQQQCHEGVLSGAAAGGMLLLVEHPPVITIGRTPGAAAHLLADAAALAERGIEVVQTDRGGDITFHGPGQLVVYPIIPLNCYHLGLHDYMRLLEQVVIDTLAEFALTGLRQPPATGVWVRRGAADVDNGGKVAGGLAKICAIGVRLRRWVSLHGLALNVQTDLSYFELINPCGLGRPVTSMQAELGERSPAPAQVKAVLARRFLIALASATGGPRPPGFGSP